MSVVTISTDFGIADYAAGLLNGVVWNIAPSAEIVVLSHDIPRHDVMSGAHLLERSLPFFPRDTVHVYVIDPGVGTQRRAIAARLGDQFFVGPDNGLITLAAQKCAANREPVEIVHLSKPDYWLKDVSDIFHGRDIFTPVGAHLANGVSLNDLGPVISDPVWLDIPSPISQPGIITGQVMQVDHFGNLSTNILTDQILPNESIQITLGNRTIKALSRTFGDGKPGSLLALIDSSGRLSICVVNGSAANFLHLQAGAEVRVTWGDSFGPEKAHNAQ
jgi:S-adenosylmethionine hydrolase